MSAIVGRRMATVAILLAIVATAAPVNFAQTSEAGAAGKRSDVRRLRPTSLSFEANRGQADPRVKFVSRSARDTVFLTADEAVVALRTASGSHALRMRLHDANDDPDIHGLEPQPARTYYVNAATRGPVDTVPAYQRVRYSSVYPGIDLEYYRNDAHLEFDFIVAPHADASRIALSFSGAETIARSDNGELFFRIGDEEVVLRRPIAYQTNNGSRRDVAAAYVLAGTDVRLDLGPYDPALPLVIDPVIVHATYLGGAGEDRVVGSDVNKNGDVHVFGTTLSGLTFPNLHAVPALQPHIEPLNCYVSKVSRDGSTLLASVVFEGFGICTAFEVDGDRVHVAMQSILGDYGGFLQLRTLTWDSNGGLLVAPLKGALAQIPGRPTRVDDIRTDAFGNTYLLYQQLVQGDTALQSRLMKVDSAGSVIGALDLGVPADPAPAARAIAADNFGQVYVVGSTSGTITPTLNALQSIRPVPDGCQENGFLIQVDTNALPFQEPYVSYLAGSHCDTPVGIVRDPSGVLYVTGRSMSDDLLENAGHVLGIPATGSPGGDAFLLRLNPSLDGVTQLLGGRFLGVQLGTGAEGVADVYHPLALFPSGELAITGGALAASFSLDEPLFDATASPGYARFVRLLLSESLDTIVSTHLDSAGDARHSVIAGPRRNFTDTLDRNYLIAITQTGEGNLATGGAMQSSPAGDDDLVIRRIDYSDIRSNFAPVVQIQPGPTVTLTAASDGFAQFDLSCDGCDIEDFDEAEAFSRTWIIDGVHHVVTQPFIGQAPLSVGVHKAELVVADGRGGMGSDTVLITVEPFTQNEPPVLSVQDQTVAATSPFGAQFWLYGSVTDLDGDTLDVTWIIDQQRTIQFSVTPPYFSNNAATFLSPPLAIGTHATTLRVSDERGHIVTQAINVTVTGINTTAGSGVTVTPTDDNTPVTSPFTPGRIRVTFETVKADGLTWFRTRTDQVPPPPGPPAPKQLGSSPFYYDVATTVSATGDIRLCIDTTGMSFTDRSAIRLYRLNGGTWEDVTAPPLGGEAAANLLCGVVHSTAELGTFAIFTPADETTRVKTIIGNGNPFEPGAPAPGDGGPADQAPLTPSSLVFDTPRQVAYVTDVSRIRRIDLVTNTITTVAGTGTFDDITSEQDGANALDVDIAPGRIAVDRNGNLFFAGINACSILRLDIQTNRIRRVAGIGPDPTTLECRYAGDGGLATQAVINGGWRLAFDAEGNLFFLQQAFTPGLPGPGVMVRRIAAGPDGLITGDDPAEIISTVAGGGTQWPPPDGDPRVALIDGHDFAFNQQGDLYVGGTAVVVRITPAPGSSLIDGSPGEQLTTVAGYSILTNAPYQGDGGRALDANLNGLFGIEILPNGDLVIADTSASRIRRVFAGGDGVVNGGTDETIETIAGYSENSPNPYTVPFNESYALSTPFSYPLDVVVDPRGGLAIVDGIFNRIRHIGVLAPGGDTTPPVLTLPEAITVEAETPAGTVVNFLATALDDVSGSVAVSCTPASGSVFPFSGVGPTSTTVTCSATDAAGNIATRNFVVTVQDTTAPAVTAPPAITVAATQATGARGNVPQAPDTPLLLLFLQDGSASDIADAQPLRLPVQHVVCGNPSSLPEAITDSTLFAVGQNCVEFQFRDGSGNIGRAAGTLQVSPPIGGPVDVAGVPVVARDLANQPQPVTTTFAVLDQPGLVTARPISPPLPPPNGVTFMGPVFDIRSTALAPPAVAVCIDFREIEPGDRLFLFENGNWIDRTASVDVNALKICGVPTSLGTFAIGRSTTVVIDVMETITVTDTPILLAAVRIGIDENILVTDTPGVLPSAMIGVTENIVVNDAPVVLPPRTIVVTEQIIVNDAPAPLPSRMIGVSENIVVNDAALVEPPVVAPLALTLSPVTATSDTGVPFTLTATINDGSLEAARVSLTAPSGQLIRVQFVNPGAANQPLMVSMSGLDLVVTLATGASGALTSTAAHVAAAINAHPAAASLIVAQVWPGTTGAGIVQPRPQTPLVRVNFTSTGPGALSNHCDTSVPGACAVTYSSSNVGTDLITAYIDINRNGSRESNEPSATAQKTWTAAPFLLTGSGFNSPELPAYRAVFELLVASPLSPASYLKYTYTRTRMNFVSSSITAAQRVGQTVTFMGTGTVNGVAGYNFSATAFDGTPDRFQIVIVRPDGTVLYSAPSLALAGGAFTLQ